MASYCSLSNSRLCLPSFSKENLIAYLKSSSRPRSQTPSCIRTSRLRSLTGITGILLFKTDFPRVLRFPVPLDKGNEDSGDEIECPTFNKHRSAAFQIRYQVLSVLAPSFGVLFERCEMSELVSISWSFFTV